MLKYITVLLLGLLVFNLLTGFHKTREERANRAIDEISTRLDLTENQISQLTLINDQFTKVRKELEKERQSYREEFVEMLASDEFNGDKLNALIKDMQRQVDDIVPQLLESVADLHRSLDPEQRKALVHEIEEHVLILQSWKRQS